MTDTLLPVFSSCELPCRNNTDGFRCQTQCPCQNGGICHSLNAHRCACPPGWMVCGLQERCGAAKVQITQSATLDSHLMQGSSPPYFANGHIQIVRFHWDVKVGGCGGRDAPGGIWVTGTGMSQVFLLFPPHTGRHLLHPMPRRAVWLRLPRRMSVPQFGPM